MDSLCYSNNVPPQGNNKSKSNSRDETKIEKAHSEI